MFVKLKTPGPGLEREHAATLRELSSSGVYRVLSSERDGAETFYTLAGGWSHYNAALFEEVKS